MNKIEIKNAKVYEDGHFTLKDVVIPTQGDSVSIDGTGKYLLPGFVDLHVHFRQPGFEQKETIKTGSLAAAAGGYTTVCTMPNLKPVPDSVEHINIQLEAIKKDALVRTLPFASITMEEKGEKLSDIEGLAPLAVGFSDDGRGVQSEEMMLSAMKKIRDAGSFISAHCEDNELVKGGAMHQGERAKELGVPGICSESEWKPVKRDIALATTNNVKYHICHISAKESLEAVRQAKAQGFNNISCEVTPHQINLCDEDITENIGRFKMNPPLRTKEDRQAIIDAIKDGTIDCIATDHAPHTKEEKQGDFTHTLFGIVGLETAFSVCYTTLVKSGIISMEDLVKLMSLRPAEIIGLKPEETAKDWALVDTEALVTVNPEEFKTKGRSTPFEGMTFSGKVVATIAQGNLVYHS